ncbi:hypothetical protein [Candidatus Cyanaurora vandensis]|uniref:hypothetical protein n=1 Tax=Candidatus Cyanaurora vandensis TaxID=2714958 RepID=UPI002579F174|nr:hypothetical protein [Candidatus Cyanaurora vandensis]
MVMQLNTAVARCTLMGADHTQERLAGTIACAHAQFQGRLYLSVLYAFLEGDQDRGKVLCYTGETWETVFQAPFVDAEEGFFQSSEALYSTMAVFQGTTDTAPCLYVSLVSVVGALLLRSEDGTNFEILREDSLGTPGLLGLRKLLVVGDRLYALALGTTEETPTEWSELPSIYVTHDLQAGDWQTVSTANFGQSTNEGIAEIGAFEDQIFAATVNREDGCQLWRSALTDGDWQEVFIKGASRFVLNQLVTGMAAFQSDLYMVTGISPLSLMEAKEFNFVAPEVLRVHPDNSWDLISGTPRFSPYGLKIPLSALGPGFNEPTNTRMPFLLAHQDRLYVGTQGFKGFQMWSSADGEDWSPVELEGVRQKRILTARSTPLGLVLVLDIGTEQHTTGLEIWVAQ